jgi:hypothetical protein
MDKNTITGTILLFVVLIGFYIYNVPSEEEIKLAKFKRDSLAYVEKSYST